MAQRFSVARPLKEQYRPAFTVKKLDGKRTEELITWDNKGQKQVKLVEVDAGYMVYMRNGHSIRVRDEANLKRLGFDQTIPLVDDEGESVAEIPNLIITEPEDA